MDTLVKLVGLNIRQIRKVKNMTQDELAEKCGLQTSYLAGVERGDRNITLQTLEKIIGGLMILPENIFNFGSINLDNYHFKKEELISLLANELNNKSEEEIRLILNITKDIFNTYGK